MEMHNPAHPGEVLRELYLPEGISVLEAAKKLGVSRQTVNALETGKYDPSLPLAMRADPFGGGLRGFIGSEGHVRLPVHGVFPFSKVEAAQAAAAALVESRRAEIERHDLRITYLTAVSAGWVVFEPVVWWPDAIGPYRARHAPSDLVEQFGGVAPNPEARAAGTALRRELAALFSAMGVFGGYLVGVRMIGVDEGSFWSQMEAAVDFDEDVLNGVIKSLVFGVAITWIAVFEGYDAPPTAEGVSGATTRTVVTSSLAILGLDFILTAFMFRGI